ncbi:MAG TPA: prepilin-type N-terminal cleavage/methylation domain-containing protein [bacterium]|jgi:prepilin-type N-terminal cleavage/methylation domain-containing protein|nr:prepilin-type N-terminal cleavage/methylation domain-containing protein [bacterium]
MNLPKYSRGFTLIEIIVVVSIIAIISGGIIPSFFGYVENQNLKQAKEQLKSDLRTVQNRALTGALSDYVFDVGGAKEPAGYWVVYFQNDSGAYSTSITSRNSGCPPSPSSNQATYNLPNDIKYYGASKLCLYFSIKNGDINKSPSLAADCIEIKTSSSSSTSERVCFNSAGLIY